MSLFGEQIRQRENADQEYFEDSVLQLAGAVTGRSFSEQIRDKGEQTRDAVSEILGYYHIKQKKLPDEEMDLEEILESSMRPSGYMWREVELTKKWYVDASGPMLGVLKESGLPIALIQKGVLGYYYTDPTTGQSIRVSGKNEKEIERDAIAFYRPFPLKKMKMLDLFRFIWVNIPKSNLLLYLMFALIATLVGLISPALIDTLFSDVVASGSIRVLIAIAIFMVNVAISNLMFQVVQGLILERINGKMNLTVEAATMMRILSLKPSFFKQYASGDLSDRTTYMGTLVNQLVDVALSTGVTSIFSLVYIVQIFAYAPGLVVPALTVAFVTVIISIAATFMQMNISKKKMETAAKENGMSFALISGIQKIKLAGAERRAFSRWGRLYAREVGYEYNPPTFLKTHDVISSAVSVVGTIVVYYIAVRTGVSDSQYFAFNASFGIVSGALTAIASAVASIATIKPTVDMARPIMEAEPEIAEKKEVITSLSGSIEINNVSFQYSESMPKVLDNLTLRIRSGQYVAIVGRTGCGKSTLVRLLLGFEKPQKGAILYDGHDLESIDLRSLRRKIGTVMQSGKLFSGDIYSNIAISAPDLTMDEAWEAAEMAGIADDIRDMPMGMYTYLSEGEGGISGGQRQRIMIARAVAPKPKVLIFDEATSALDNLTQKKISDALNNLQCTRIVVAHRLSTIRQCDRILVLDQGHVIEDGTYDELVAKKGFFADLVQRQQIDDVDDVEEIKDKEQEIIE